MPPRIIETSPPPFNMVAIADRDMIFLSDPCSGAGAISHSKDGLVLLPLFKDGRLIAGTAMFGHHCDNGAIAGRPLGDGPDAHLLRPGFTNVSYEFLERSFLLRIERYAAAPGSRGAGLHSGGNGIPMSYRFPADGDIAIQDDRWFLPPSGGGRRGALRANCEAETGLPAAIQPVRADAYAMQEAA